MGNSCCEFICLDDTLTKTSSDGHGPDGGTDISLRFIATAVTIILSLFLFIFLIHRLRQRKIRGNSSVLYVWHDIWNKVLFVAEMTLHHITEYFLGIVLITTIF